MTIFYNPINDFEKTFELPIEYFLIENQSPKECHNIFNKQRRSYKPALDIREYEDKYKASIDLAGFNKDEIDISIHDHKLTVKTTRKNESNSSSDNVNFKYVINERNDDNLSAIRTWKLPEHITESNIEASFNNGLLTLSYSKHAPESEPKKVNIQ